MIIIRHQLGLDRLVRPRLIASPKVTQVVCSPIQREQPYMCYRATQHGVRAGVDLRLCVFNDAVSVLAV